MKTFAALVLGILLVAQYASSDSTFVYSSRDGYNANRTRVDPRLNQGAPTIGYGQYPPQGYSPGMYYYPQFNGVYYSTGNTSMTMGTVTINPVRPYYRPYR